MPHRPAGRDVIDTRRHLRRSGAGGAARRRWPGLAGVLLLAGALAGGCASGLGQETVVRSGLGPSAREVFVMRSVLVYGRGPSFDEMRRWQDQMDDRVFRYLREHPALEQSERYSDFRFFRQVTPGSTRGEVRTLLDEPDERTIDSALMAVLAAANWTAIQAKAREAWVYPGGWVLYFDEGAVVEITRVGRSRES